MGKPPTTARRCSDGLVPPGGTSASDESRWSYGLDAPWKTTRPEGGDAHATSGRIQSSDESSAAQSIAAGA